MTPQLWDRIRDWFFLVVLLTISVALMIGRNDAMVRSLRAVALQVTAQVEFAFAWVGGYIRALEENRSLRTENIYLSSQVARLRESQIENERLREMIAFRDHSEFDLIPTRIVHKDLTRQENTLLIDVGLSDGVTAEMPVINDRGIIGKVVLAADSYSIVQAYLNTEFRISAKVQPSQAAGIVRWEGQRTDRLIMEHVVRTEPVEVGQLVVTSGYSNIFPPGIPIGTIETVQVSPGRNEFNLTVTPLAGLTHAEHAFVILREPKPEISSMLRRDEQ